MRAPHFRPAIAVLDLGKAIGPVRMAFFASLLLSLIAVWNNPVLNRDGMLYIEWAQKIINNGSEGLYYAGQPSLLALPLLISGLSWATGLSPEAAGQLLNALFLAGTCALIVVITRNRRPEASWAACLVVLAMPAYNGYRGEILREYGFWFFSVLAIWLAMRWDESPPWREAILCQVSIGLAAMFRLEAVAFYPALMAWQLFSAPPGLRLRRAFMIGCLPVAGVLVAAMIYGSGLIEFPTRMAYFLEAANPLRKIQMLDEAGKKISDAGLLKYKFSREEAGYILFFGLLSIIPMKFIQMSGALLVPFIFLFITQPARAALARWHPLTWAFLAYTCVLAAFVTHMFFLTGRYVSLLNLLAVPIIAVGLALMMDRFPRWRALTVAVALTMMLANVVSFSPKKTHMLEAGAWLAGNVKDASRVYVDDGRIGFYAGLGIVGTGQMKMDRTELSKAIAENRFDMIAMEVAKKDADFETWAAENRLHILKRFSNKAGNAVVVAVVTTGTDR